MPDQPLLLDVACLLLTLLHGLCRGSCVRRRPDGKYTPLFSLLQRTKWKKFTLKFRFVVGEIIKNVGRPLQWKMSLFLSLTSPIIKLIEWRVIFFEKDSRKNKLRKMTIYSRIKNWHQRIINSAKRN